MSMATVKCFVIYILKISSFFITGWIIPLSTELFKYYLAVTMPLVGNTNASKNYWCNPILDTNNVFLTEGNHEQC